MCVVRRSDWRKDTNFWETLEIRRHSMDWNELLHTLSTLLPGMVFAFHLVFSFCGTLQGAGRDQPEVWNPFCSTLWTGFCLTSLHTVILWCTMRCPMILSMIGRLSARTSGVCSFRENQESSRICGNSLRDAETNKLAFPQMERGSRLGVHREAGLSFSGSVEIKCLTVLSVYCVFCSLSERW